MNETLTQERTLKFISLLGKAAAVMTIIMWFAYIPQIMNNLAGSKTPPLQPFVAAINCTLWFIYAVAKEKKDWPLIIANFPGIFFALAAALTGL